MSTPVATVTIPNGKAVSNLLPLPGTNFQLTGILVPNGWSSAGIQVLGSFDGVNTFPIWSLASGGLLTVTSANVGTTGIIIAMRFDDMTPVPYIAIQSGTQAAPVNQTGDKILTLQFRAFQ